VKGVIYGQCHTSVICYDISRYVNENDITTNNCDIVICINMSPSSFSYRMANGPLCYRIHAFTHTIVMVQENVQRPFHLVPNSTWCHGTSLQQHVLRLSGFNICQPLTSQHRATGVAIDGSHLMEDWPHGVMATVYMFLRIQEGK
jgi:hypothetical protein